MPRHGRRHDKRSDPGRRDQVRPEYGFVLDRRFVRFNRQRFRGVHFGPKSAVEVAIQLFLGRPASRQRLLLDLRPLDRMLQANEGDPGLAPALHLLFPPDDVDAQLHVHRVDRLVGQGEVLRHQVSGE